MARITKTTDKWVEVPDDEDGARILFRHLKKIQIADIEATANPVKFKTVDGRAESEIRIDVKRKRELLTVAAVKDWEGFFGTDGEKLKCSEKNKLRALREFDWFYPLVEKSIEGLAEEVEEKERQAEKN